jgi:hypothetical protein
MSKREKIYLLLYLLLLSLFLWIVTGLNCGLESCTEASETGVFVMGVTVLTVLCNLYVYIFNKFDDASLAKMDKRLIYFYIFTYSWFILANLTPFGIF